jgi:hypothetical protein
MIQCGSIDFYPLGLLYFVFPDYFYGWFNAMLMMLIMDVDGPYGRRHIRYFSGYV